VQDFVGHQLSLNLLGPAKEELGRRLHAGYDGPKRLWSFPGQEHWEVIKQPADVWLEVLRFLLPE
jgi:hypothetical protein